VYELVNLNSRRAEHPEDLEEKL